LRKEKFVQYIVIMDIGIVRETYLILSALRAFRYA